MAQHQSVPTRVAGAVPGMCYGLSYTPQKSYVGAPTPSTWDEVSPVPPPVLTGVLRRRGHSHTRGQPHGETGEDSHLQAKDRDPRDPALPTP